jgi:hypothetical protein
MFVTQTRGRWDTHPEQTYQVLPKESRTQLEMPRVLDTQALSSTLDDL